MAIKSLTPQINKPSVVQCQRDYEKGGAVLVQRGFREDKVIQKGAWVWVCVRRMGIKRKIGNDGGDLENMEKKE